MSTRLVVLRADDLKNLLTVYTDGAVPLDAELTEVSVHPYMERSINLTMKSKQWQETTYDPVLRRLRPLLVRYEGKKTLSWHQKKEEEYNWKETSLGD
jgi:hypothetical protein